MAETKRIVLIGFSGTGKSTVARILADRLGWSTIDTDERIEDDLGLTIPDIFARHGETVFRDAERRMLSDALERDRVVVATGGGAVVDPAVWEPGFLGDGHTLVIALDVNPATTLERLLRQQEHEGRAVARPLLAGANPLRRISELKSSRQQVYDRAHITLVVDNLPPAEVAAEIAALLSTEDARVPSLRLAAPSGQSEIFIAPGASDWSGELICRRWPRARRAWIVTDEAVGRHHLARIDSNLRGAGLAVERRAVPRGEGSKSLAMVSDLLDWLLNGGAERADVVVALGGGMVGDLAGFVAASCLRGLGLVQMPTSLLAMVDSSVGGKTGVNHRAGKNLIGAFYQPHLVIIDPRFLSTLPRRELNSGWAEVLKHGVIQPSTPDGARADLLTFYERNAERLASLAEPATTYAIGRNVTLKAAVVAADERESGIRAYLNFGHTLGHAIEAAGFRYLHGEAIAAGMRAATRVGEAMETADRALVDRIDFLIRRYGLPEDVCIDQERALSLTGSDKKRAAGRLRWILPLTAGGVTIRDDVPVSAVRDGLMAVTRHEPAADSAGK